ncbi:endonuclease MutS2 [Bellilinea caldifistulae]|nr:endonuclease MutS2 [Bellilinea caldifistulae]
MFKSLRAAVRWRGNLLLVLPVSLISQAELTEDVSFTSQSLFILDYNQAAMDVKSLTMLEFPKVLERLAGYADFSASAGLARALRPTADLAEALTRQAITSEARRLLSVKSEAGIGGARDVRPLAERAARSGVLLPAELLEIKSTLIAARDLFRTLESKQAEYPHLAAIAQPLAPPPGLIEAISRTISDRGEVLDSASPKLASLRSEIKTAHERLLSRLQKMIQDPKNTPHLQEAIITMRNGRYVIPLRAESRGRIRAIVHDQSSSGATLFVEPLSVVELNNAWHELQLAERDEERRILSELSNQIGEHSPAIIAIVDALARLDLAFMCAKYAEDLHAAEPVLTAFRKTGREKHPGSVIVLYQARHPLLDPQTVVPVDVVLDENTYALVITGPNTGGKTVTLKTVGLLALMAQSGLHIPAQSGSTLSIFRNIYADIGDEQSIEQSLSTFSGHITNIVRILRRMDSFSLVLLDELGAGTDPQEGSALARAILGYLVEKRVTSLIATHYPELKAYAHATPGVVNASMEFDLRSLKPTYRLTIGLPGRSNALAIAERLGLPPEILSAARSMINPTDLRAEDLLDEIHRQRDLARKARSEADRLRSQAENMRRELAQRLEKIEEERRAILEKARREQEEEIAALRAELDALRRELQRARQPLDALKPLQERLEELQSEAEKPVERTPIEPARPLRLGEKVRLRSLQMEGVITALGQSEIEVQMGNLRLRARPEEIERPGSPPPPENPSPTPPSTARPLSTGRPAAARPAVFTPSPGMELDLRGQRADEALEALQRYLESAYLSGMPFVRVIHGKGTGKLRQAVREFLKQNEFVASWETGLDSEGGEGVTVVHLREG